MSTAILNSRATINSAATGIMECESCHCAMTVSPNPYFGTGLAIHRNIAECESCGAVAFVPEPEAAPGFIERLVAFIRRLFAGTATR